jgi:hypothetical protein
MQDGRIFKRMVSKTGAGSRMRVSLLRRFSRKVEDENALHDSVFPAC